MLIHRLEILIRSQRGVALPMALLTMLILSALIIAFSMMAASEPVLANNQLQVAQARAVAESGVERAIWALNNPANANGIPNPPIYAAPYTGVTPVPVMVNGAQMGVFTVSVVTNGALANARDIVATGWTPTNTGTGPKVKQKIQVTVIQNRFFLNPPPSPLTVRGEISVGGAALIDSREDTTTCGPKPGTMSRDATLTSGARSAVYGATDGNDVKNESTDIIQNVPNATFDEYTYSNVELDALKALAKKNGTYYQGTVAFNASNRMPDGVIYVDTVSGQNIDKNGANTTPTSDFASVNIDGNAASGDHNTFSGMLIVAGTLTVHGNIEMHGMVYVLNDFVYLGTGTGKIVGAVLSQNIRDVSATTIDTDTSGNSTIIWNCNYARTGGGWVPPTFTIEAGTYKEISG